MCRSPPPPPPPLAFGFPFHKSWIRHCTLYWYGTSTGYSGGVVRTDSLFCCVSSYVHKNLLRPARTVASLVPRSRACHKHCGLGSNPVINGVVSQ